jgi:hypothetical protein
MGGTVTAQFKIGSRSNLTRAELDQIIQILNIRDRTGNLVQPPVGQACDYILVLEKSGQRLPND